MTAVKTQLKTDYLATAREAYGDALPDWVEELAKYASQTSGVQAAKRIGYSSSVVTSICRGKYAGDIASVEGSVRGALMGAMVICPVLGEIGRDQCLQEQGKKFVGSSAARTALYHECRNGCPHSRIRNEGGADV
ncbi:transcriptional regulator [Methylocystis sp. WRRC1]|uniref:hypothetical protein n=1 Tax=unclassified Methylocystis TaxID=2625913 RepID=UPI0001F86843|nr:MULTISPECIES: hypothetical protein [unclassified Methylocystis]MCC3246179.1 transcriptional regulator [Methylocystis sp. WRRC1]